MDSRYQKLLLAQDDPEEYARVLAELAEQDAAEQAERQSFMREQWERWGDVRGCHRITCVVCGHIVFRTTPRAKYCSATCQDRARSERAARRRREARAKTCPSCGAAFTGARTHSLYCSPACRQKAYRARARGRKVPVKQATT